MIGPYLLRYALIKNAVYIHYKGIHKIVMIRHGESEWNQKNLFCGWFDAELSEKGRREACEAGRILCKLEYKFDEAHTSLLMRAQCTLDAILKAVDQKTIPVYATWRLNERHYGALTGLNKAETVDKYGEKQVKIWRRSYNIPPPPMTLDHVYYKHIVEDVRYENVIEKEKFPMFESLEMTIKRTLPYWNEKIVPQIKKGKTIIIAAHGNSLRGIVKHLDCLSEEDIMELNLPTGIPFLYELDDNMKPITSMKFLGDEATVKKAMEAVAAQGKQKK